MAYYVLLYFQIGSGFLAGLAIGMTIKRSAEVDQAILKTCGTPVWHIVAGFVFCLIFWPAILFGSKLK